MKRVLNSSEINTEFLQNLAEVLADRLGRSIDTITEEEIQASLEILLSESVDNVEYACTHTQFERQATATPEALALLVDDPQLVLTEQQLSYAGLNCRANQLARYLQRCGVTPGTVVAVCLESPIERVVSLLAVLKSGAAYLALSPNDPPAYQTRILAQARPQLILIQERLVGTVSASAMMPINIDVEWPQIARESTDNIATELDLTAAAYLVSTSDKVIVVEHCGLANCLYWLQTGFALTGRDRLLAMAEPTLDVAIWELLWPLSCGATVVFGATILSMPAELLMTIDAQQISVMHLTPSALRRLLDEVDTQKAVNLSALRQVLCSGAPLRRSVVEQFFRLNTARLSYLYGPPSAAALVTMYTGEQRVPQELLPIGQPSSNLSVYVLDGYLQPVPAGVIGELCIAGGPLARGYLHDPEATAQRFMMSPFPASGDERLLRTGDCGRRLNDGTFELVSNMARQVWIDGFCVEVDWIAAQLLTELAIAECVVLARDTTRGETELVAYVVPDGPFIEANLRRYAEALLPRSLVPSAYVPLSNLPLTASGQIDKRALVGVPVIDKSLIKCWEIQLCATLACEKVVVVVRQHLRKVEALEMPAVPLQTLTAYITEQPDDAALTKVAALQITDRFGTLARCTLIQVDEFPRDEQGAISRQQLSQLRLGHSLDLAYASPRTELERQLVTIWEEVLGVQRISIYDRFFDLGGDSILAIQVIARAGQMGLRLSPEQVFRNQSVAQLATFAGTAHPIHAEQGLVTGSVPLTPAQCFFFEHDLPMPEHFNHAYLFEAREPIVPERFEKVLHQLVHHHDALRLRFVHGEGGWQQFIAPVEQSVLCATIDLAALPEVERWSAFEARAAGLQASLDLAHGPLLRVLVALRGSGELPLVLMIIHHLVIDGLSWQILLEDLDTAYAQLSRGAPFELPPKTTSFKFWAERLAVYAKSANVREDLGYWLAQSWPGDTCIPRELPGANLEQSADNVSIDLSSAETQKLLTRVPRSYDVQITDVMLTAMVQSFARWTGKRRLLVDIAHHGRIGLFEDIDLSRTVGWFSTFHPIVLDLGSIADPVAELQAVKRQIERVPQQGLTYSLLRYLCSDAEIAAQLGEIPRPQVLMTYTGKFYKSLPETGVLRLIGSSVGPIHHCQGTRMYELVFNQLVTDEQLGLGLTYSNELHQRVTVERLADGYMDALRTFIARCDVP
jgi:amino acid adenylation domain-containing protein/non-ribosomal peptide synthase protein (TIGR01720 family)